MSIRLNMNHVWLLFVVFVKSFFKLWHLILPFRFDSFVLVWARRLPPVWPLRVIPRPICMVPGVVRRDILVPNSKRSFDSSRNLLNRLGVSVMNFAKLIVSVHKMVGEWLILFIFFVLDFINFILRSEWVFALRLSFLHVYLVLI